jgi:hypothetical protein
MDSVLLRAGALMTMAVVTVPASMPIASVAGFLADRGISSDLTLSERTRVTAYAAAASCSMSVGAL